MAALTLNTLQEDTLDQLNRTFREAKFPEEGALDGDLQGNVPGVRSDSFLAMSFKPIGLMSRTGVLPWLGKSFDASGNDLEGINRIIFNRFKLFRFETYKGPSIEDGKDCLVLDYNVPSNPFFMGYIRDELRQVNEDLFLGQMYLTIGSMERPILYFALEKEEDRGIKTDTGELHENGSATTQEDTTGDVAREEVSV